MPKKTALAKKSVAIRRGAPKRASERIRETARDLFYRQGIRAVGVDEIVLRAGVTKPSLYRSFESKDELAAACLRDRGEDFLRRFDAKMKEAPSDPRGQFLGWLDDLSKLATAAHYRGCGVTNAAVEYPERGHPARRQVTAHKQKFRLRLVQLAKDIHAKDPQILADAFFLLMEGVYTSGQLIGPNGPPRVVAAAAATLIDAHMPQGRSGGKARNRTDRRG